MRAAIRFFEDKNLDDVSRDDVARPWNGATAWALARLHLGYEPRPAAESPNPPESLSTELEEDLSTECWLVFDGEKCGWAAGVETEEEGQRVWLEHVFVDHPPSSW